MTEKIRSFNLISPTVSGSVNSGVGGGSVAIGNPTLISSTLSTHHTLTPTVDLINARDTNSSPPAIQMVSTLAAAAAATTATACTNIAIGTTVTAQLNFHISGDSSGNGAMAASCVDYNSIMNSSQISAITNDSMLPVNNYTQTPATTMPSNCMSLVKAGAGKPIIAQSVAGKSCRFPKLEECAHFHYERVQLGPLTVRLSDDKADLLNSSIASQSIGGDIAGTAGNFCMSSGGLSSLRSFSPSTCWFIIKVSPHRSDAFLIKRSFDNVQMLDEMLHRCVYDRKISGLKNLNEVDYKSEEDVEYAVAKYLERFSKIASDSLTCGTILTWFQLDNKGRRLPLADGDTMRSINTPAVGAAYGVRRYQAQASDEISIEVGDMISVIDMPAPAESIWWRGKKSHLQKSHYEVGFFPQSCVATIGDKVPRHFPMPAPLVGQLDVSPTKPVLRKHGKLIAFFRSFILSRPSRRRLKQSGIYRERVFSCDLSEHLLNSGQEIPMVLKCCAEFLEKYGIVDGIYRLSGITSNIQRLRRAFDEERIPDLGNPEMKQDIHAVSSLLKMYFRELPNPLCTYQLYDNFVEAIQAKVESNERLRLMKETVLKLPPPHYRTLKYLAEHLNKISQHAERTGMTDKNLAIVWAPNLLRSPALESGGVAALRGVGVQAVVTEYLIKNCQQIFDTLEDATTRLSYIATQGAQPTCQPPLYGIDSRLDSLTDCESLLVEQREHDQSLTCAERPKSLGTGGPKLISLEEAQERHLKLETFEMKHSMPINMTSSVNSGPNIGSYIEVGGGPSSLPDKYHTVLSVPRSWQKRKTHSWKSLFTRNQRPISNGAAHDLKSSIVVHKHDCDHAMATPLPRNKESAQVTFADTDSIIGLSGRSTTKGSLSKREDKQHKSIELFETSRSYCGEPSKPIEVCVRSNSIDSLRTAGHSRSVSHDSYFDLLQSPQRSNITTCPSRELSELGLNFDREEPEMHIFSESESLVSSPRVGKENIPPSSGAATRRIMRARPEDFSSQTNSVNPSPKKQPRLNLLLSPSSATTTSATSNWSQSKSASEPECSSDNCYEHHGDESCCKRYKLEDQLSDIQFIDCGTPEHTISQPPQTLYASAQIHGPMKATLAKSSPYGALEMNTQQTKESPKTMNKTLAAATTNTPQNVRYSYPTVQLGSKRKDQDMGATNNIKERFSYPGSNLNIDRHFSAKDAISKILVEEIEINGRGGGGGGGGGGVNKKDDAQRHHNINLRNISFGGSKTAANSTNSSPKISMQQHMVSKPTSFDVMKLKSRNSCGGGLDNVQQQLLRSSSAEITKSGDVGVQSKPSLNDMEISKISVTPSSPVQSPRYSLLMGGETSSENSSAVNTPQQDLDPLMVGSITSGISAASSNQMQQLLLGVETMNYLGTSHESLGSNMTDTRDIQALKRELSLDLNPLSTKLSTEMIHLGQRPINLVSPNNSNFTDNTSQSVTPSEFGYQHLQRQLSMHSLIETEDNSPAYEEYENTPSNLNSPMKLATSPLKSTISITYNLKSPTKPDHTTNKFFGKTKDKSRPMLETSFDENTVYEQVKFFRNSVTEVNQLLCDEHKYHNTELENLAEVEELSDSENEAEKLLLLSNDSNEENYENGTHSILNNCNLEQHVDDILMMDNCSESDKLMLYENIQIRKPTTIYQNLLGEEMKGGGGVERTVSTIKLEDDSETAHLLPQEEEEVELDSLDSIKEEEGIESQRFTAAAARRSPSNLSVKELANKFESSPVEQLPAFDFHNHPLRASHKRSQHINNENKPPRNPNITSGNLLKPKLNKTQQQITRSLDENAFVREFGAKNLQDFSVRSSQQLPDITEMNNRRKSFDFTRPKTLNPPKRLPGMPITEEVYVKTKCKTQLKQEPAKEKNFNTLSYIQTGSSALENHLESGELKITPTTENRISLIQNNVIIAADNNAANNSNTTADLNNSNNLSNVSTGSSTTISTTANSSMSNSLKVLSGVKLDRERIDRIKEERRQQLTQKYYNDFKSKSKTDLHSYKNDDEKFSSNSSLRVKSKSRADMRTLQKDMDNLKEFGGRHPPSTAVSELNLNSRQHRIRSISDEKNQNNYDNTNANTNLKSNLNSNSNPNASCVADMNRRTQITKSSVQEGRSDEFSARATVQKFERKSMDFVNGINGTITGNRERQQRSSLEMSSNAYTAAPTGRNSLVTNREKISPQFSIRDVTAMFESRSQSQQ